VRIFEVIFYKFWIDNPNLNKIVFRTAAIYIITAYSCSYALNP